MRETLREEQSLPEGVAGSEEITLEELQLATRNHGMPLEALRYDLTPVGLHYLLIHFDIPWVDEGSWRLTIDGQVSNPCSFRLEELQALPRVSVPVTLECAGNGRARLTPRPVSQPWLTEAVGTAEWTGTPLQPLLEEAGLQAEAQEVLFTGLDRGVEGGVEQQYQRSLPLDEALRPEVLLAYEMNGQPLLPQHGFPLRVIVPGWYGMTHVKWLERVSVLAEPFLGYQQAEAYRITQSQDDPGTPVTRILPRALMVPPGIPDFFSRTRLVPSAPCLIEGRAWSGWAPIVRVEVSVDGGKTWQEAELGEPLSAYSWAPWRLTWQPDRLGEHELLCRAEDASGNRQPVEEHWNLQGMANNMVQRVAVLVRGEA
ncbi:MAG: sulfite oxidase [Actinomycetota bacterium]|nr:sulfite oxidase [Actinomycetota bacterium]